MVGTYKQHFRVGHWNAHFMLLKCIQCIQYRGAVFMATYALLVL